MNPAKVFFFILAILPFTASAQSIQVKKETSRIEGSSTGGYQVALTGTEEEVKICLVKYLKMMGKTKPSGDYITVAAPTIGSKKYTETLYATTRQTGSAAAAWMGVASASVEGSSLEGDLQKLVYDFAVTFHREKIQLQIDESLRALQAVEKQQLRLANQNKDLNNKVENNKREKIQLEKSLVENKLELQVLTNRLSANAKAQDSIAIATDQIRKVVEMHTEKQKRIK
jgi:ABC-type phosphate transport system auxiliary subunit